MAAGVYNIELEQGASWSMEVVYEDDLGAPIDLTGFTGRGQIKQLPSQGTPSASFTVTISNPSAGEILVSLPATESALLTAKGATYADKTTYVYDIEIVSAGGEVTRLLNGNVLVSPEVTK